MLLFSRNPVDEKKVPQKKLQILHINAAEGWLTLDLTVLCNFWIPRGLQTSRAAL